MNPSVLMVAPRYRPAVGGVEYHVERVSEELLDRGWTVTVLTSSHIQGLPLEETSHGVGIQRLPRGLATNPLHAQLWVLHRLGSFLAHDVIHFHDTYPLLAWGPPIMIARRGRGIYATFHGFESDPIRAHWRFLRKVAKRSVQRCLCVGQFIEGSYQIACDKVVIGATEKHRIASPASNRAVFVGRLERDTGILEHIRALGILRQEFGRELPLVICGSGSLELEIKSLAKKEGVAVDMKGLVDNPTQYIRGAYVCLAAGYLVMLEAMSLGVPVIGIAQSPLKMAYLKSMRRAGAPISIQTTPRGISKEIQRLLSNRALAKNMKKRSQEFAHERTWDSITDDYIRLWTH